MAPFYELIDGAFSSKIVPSLCRALQWPRAGAPHLKTTENILCEMQVRDLVFPGTQRKLLYKGICGNDAGVRRIRAQILFPPG